MRETVLGPKNTLRTDPAPEPELLKILKRNSAESANAGFQVDCYGIFNDKTHLDHFSDLLKFIKKIPFYHVQKL
jgi:hypothetical protein